MHQHPDSTVNISLNLFVRSSPLFYAFQKEVADIRAPLQLANLYLEFSIFKFFLLM